MVFISLGKIDKNLIPIIVGAFFSMLNKLLIKYKHTKLFKHKIIPNILSIFSKTLTIIPYIILKLRTKKNKNKEDKDINNNDIELIYIDMKKEQTQGKVKYIILSSVLLFIQGILVLYSLEVKSNSWIWDISATTLLYHFVLKIKLYKHHYLSIISIILLGFTIDIVFGNLQYDLSNNLLKFFFRFLREISYSFYDVVNKYLFEKKFCSVYELSFFVGLTNIILFGLFSVLNYYYLKIDNFEKYFNNFNILELIISICLIIIQLGLSLSCLITNNNNTPCHIFIIAVLGQFINYMDFSTNSIIIIVFLLLILFMTLIFTEIIEINICGLSKNTKRNIAFRAKTEDSSLENNYTIYSVNTIDENDEIIQKEKTLELNTNRIKEA